MLLNVKAHDRPLMVPLFLKYGTVIVTVTEVYTRVPSFTSVCVTHTLPAGCLGPCFDDTKFSSVLTNMCSV